MKLARSALRHRAPADYATLLESLLLALAVEMALSVLSVSRLLSVLNRLGPSTSSWPLGVERRRLPRFSAAAYHVLPIGSTCLRESLVLYGLLRRRGASPRFCLGIRKDGKAVSAHAWVECAGIPMEEASPSFEQLFQIDRMRSAPRRHE